jgi:hypothetical protein
MGVVEQYKIDGVTVGVTELSIPNGGTTLQNLTVNGSFQLMIDPVQAAVAKSDYFEVKIKEKVLSTGSQLVVFRAVVGNAQSEPWALPPLLLKNGWDMTLVKLSGTDRAWDASVRGVATTVTESFTMSAVTVGATELSIVSGTTVLQTNTTAGYFQLFLDPSNLAKGDEFVIRIYEKVEGSTGTKRQIFKASLMDVNAQAFVTPIFCLLNGWDMTVQKISGTDRAISASIRKVG